MLVRALSLKKESYRAAEVRKEFTSTRVGLLESKGVERRYEAVMPPRWGTVIVCVSGIVGCVQINVMDTCWWGRGKKSVLVERLLGYVLLGGPHVITTFRSGALER